MTLLPTVRGKRKEGRVKPIQIKKKQFKFSLFCLLGGKEKQGNVMKTEKTQKQ